MKAQRDPQQPSSAKSRNFMGKVGWKRFLPSTKVQLLFDSLTPLIFLQSDVLITLCPRHSNVGCVSADGKLGCGCGCGCVEPEAGLWSCYCQRPLCFPRAALRRGFKSCSQYDTEIRYSKAKCTV